jgi:hypothetical protein
MKRFKAERSIILQVLSSFQIRCDWIRCTKTDNGKPFQRYRMLYCVRAVCQNLEIVTHTKPVLNSLVQI